MLLWTWFIDWLIGWGGLSLVIAACAGAVWWFVPVPAIRTLALHIAIGALAFTSVYSMGYNDGAAATRTEWKAEELRAVEQGSSAHREAEQAIPPAVEEPAPATCPEPLTPGSVAPAPRKPAPVPRWMRDDRHNRDNH